MTGFGSSFQVRLASRTLPSVLRGFRGAGKPERRNEVGNLTLFFFKQTSRAARGSRRAADRAAGLASQGVVKCVNQQASNLELQLAVSLPRPDGRLPACGSDAYCQSADSSTRFPGSSKESILNT
jgi:hypothetical protein